MRTSNLNVTGLAFGLAIAICTLATVSARATEVGNIEVCYNCTNNFNDLGVLDGPTFEINDLTSTALTSVMFTADGDTYNVGTIAGNGSVVLVPGYSNDGGTHTGFWELLAGGVSPGDILDTSDSGPNLDTTQFKLTAIFGSLSATTGIFTPASSEQTESNDGTVNDGGINFLGGPGNNDGPCSNCYGPDVVATINTANTATPIPAALPLFASGLGAIGLIGWRRKRKRAVA